MADSYSIGPHFKAFIQVQLASRRYGNASEVVRDALRLMGAREKKFAALDAAIFASLAAAGDVVDAETVFDELEAKLRALPEQAAE